MNNEALRQWYLEYKSKKLLDDKELKKQIIDRMVKGQLSPQRASILLYYYGDH